MVLIRNPSMFDKKRTIVGSDLIAPFRLHTKGYTGLDRYQDRGFTPKTLEGDIERVE